MGLILVSTSFIAGQLTKNIGRKPILMYGNLGCGLSNLLIGIFLKLKYNNPEEDIYIYCSLTIIFIYLICFGLSLGPITWLYNPEILPGKGVWYILLI